MQSGSLIGLAAYLLSYQAAPAAPQLKGVRRSYSDVQAATVLKPLVQAARSPGALGSIVARILRERVLNYRHFEERGVAIAGSQEIGPQGVIRHRRGNLEGISLHPTQKRNDA